MEQINDWLAEAVEAEAARHATSVAVLDEMRAWRPDLDRCVAQFGGHLWTSSSGESGPHIYWNVTVEDFRDAASLIEAVEAFAGECTSHDWPEFRQRDFTFRNLVVSCGLAGDATACRVVVRGFKAPEPILAFECAA